MSENAWWWLGFAVFCLAGIAWNNPVMWTWLLDQVIWIVGSMLSIIWLVPLMWPKERKRDDG